MNVAFVDGLSTHTTNQMTYLLTFRPQQSAVSQLSIYPDPKSQYISMSLPFSDRVITLAIVWFCYCFTLLPSLSLMATKAGQIWNLSSLKNTISNALEAFTIGEKLFMPLKTNLIKESEKYSSKVNEYNYYVFQAT